MNEPATVRTVKPGEAETAVATVVMAFSGDPAARWMYPDPQQYLLHFPRFVRAFGGKAFHHGSAHMAGDGSAAALWLPPDVAPDEDELMRILNTTVDEGIRHDLFAVFEQMAAFHPTQPHWYLPLIGVDAPAQNRGFGAALLRHALARCDAEGLPAYLESSNPRNVTLYRRHGFELLGEIRAGSSPPVLPMLRPPQ
ncbi:MAG: GNAT family N-acetyltransferase [Bryobacterales bacterium]|nr:GNAT family N-acetyltransferase [Bryobacterales bacterium]